jgi:hypothetical protein
MVYAAEKEYRRLNPPPLPSWIERARKFLGL